MFDFLAKPPQASRVLQSTLWLRRVLAIGFAIWLALVLIQHNKQTTQPKPKQVNEPLVKQLSLEQLPLPPMPRVAIKSVPIKKVTEQQTPPRLEPAPNSALSERTQTVEQVYQQLSDEGIDIQIAWPQNARERESTLRFMYQCAEMQFALLNGEQITKLTQPKPSQNTMIVYSGWVRVAQGSLSKKEQNWLNAYAVTGTPIRLFPRQIDWHLAQYLANTLQGKALKSFRANYQVEGGLLKLNHIYLNQQSINQIWQLFKGNC